MGKTGGYANNFGEPVGGGTRVDAVIVSQLLKPLLSRLVESRKELQGHENIVSIPKVVTVTKTFEVTNCSETDELRLGCVCVSGPLL